MHKASVLLTLLNLVPVFGIRNEGFLQNIDVSIDIHDRALIDPVNPKDEDNPEENKMSFRNEIQKLLLDVEREKQENDKKNEAGPFFLSPRDIQELLLDYQDVEREKQENDNNMKSNRAKEEREGMSKLALDSILLIFLLYTIGGMLLFLIGAILYHAINPTKSSETSLV